MLTIWRCRSVCTLPAVTKQQQPKHLENLTQLPTLKPLKPLYNLPGPSTAKPIIGTQNVAPFLELPVNVEVKSRAPVAPFQKPFVSSREERNVISILHLVGLYDSETKPLIKVTHLQELSRSSFTITEFKRDRRFLALLKTIHNDIIPNASSKQLQIISASYTRLKVRTLKLWYVVLRRTLFCAQQNLLTPLPYRMCNVTGSNICFILYKISEREVRPYALLSRLFAHLGKVSSELCPTDIERALSAMRRLRMEPVKLDNFEQKRRLETLSALCRKTKKDIRSIKPTILVRIIRHLSALGYIPVNFLGVAEAKLLTVVKELPPESLASLARSYSKMRLWQPNILYSLAVAVAAKVPETKPDVLSTSLMALVQQGIRKRTLLESICTQVQQWPVNKISLLTNKSVGCISMSLGIAGCRNRSTWQQLGAITQSRLEELSPIELTQYLYGTARVGLRDRQVLERIIPRITKMISAFNVEQIVAVLDSLILLGWFDQDVITLLLARYCRLDPLITTSQQMQMSRSMVTLLLEAPDIINDLPRSSQLSVERFQKQFEMKNERAYHVHLSECLKLLGLQFKMSYMENGPLSFDAIIFRRNGTLLAPNESNQPKIGLDLLGLQHFCPISTQLLGHARLKHRLGKRLGIDVVAINRLKWVQLTSQEERTDYIKNSLGLPQPKNCSSSH